MKRTIFVAFLIHIFTTTSVTYGRKLTLVGGDLASDNDAVYQAFIKQASPASKDAYIGVITAGSTWSTAETVAKGIVYRLKNMYGVPNVEWLPFHVSNGGSCGSSAYNSKLNSMTGLFINGGDTQTLINCLNPNGRTTSALSVIKQRSASNQLAIFASSAATLVLQSTPVLLGRLSWGALLFGSDCDMNGGFDIFTYGFLDVHFTNRGNIGRLIRLAMDHKSYAWRAFGIDQDTAMILDGNGFKVMGSGGVYIISTTQATTNSSNAKFNVKNLRVTYLTDGDWMNLDTGAVLYASYKKTISEINSTPRTSLNIFSDQAFEILATSLVQSKISDLTYGVTKEPYPTFRLDLRKTSSTDARSGYSNGMSLISYTNLFLDVYCSNNC